MLQPRQETNHFSDDNTRDEGAPFVILPEAYLSRITHPVALDAVSP